MDELYSHVLSVLLLEKKNVIFYYFLYVLNCLFSSFVTIFFSDVIEPI